MKRLLLSCTLLCLAGSAAGAAPPEGDYKLVWHDEFDGEALDLTKWDYRGLGPRRDAVNTKESVRVDGEGHLVLTTSKVGGEYHTGMVGTQGKFETTFAYFECRVKMQTQVGHWSAFWLQSPTINEVGDSRVNGVEMDIFEYLASTPDLLRMNLHWDGYGDEHKSSGFQSRAPGLSEGYHTIGLEWLPEGYALYVDGKKLAHKQVAPSHRSQYIILSLEVGKWAGDIGRATLPDSVYFDYVRVYQRPR